jgi:hypothetical protein
MIGIYNIVPREDDMIVIKGETLSVMWTSVQRVCARLSISHNGSSWHKILVSLSDSIHTYETWILCQEEPLCGYGNIKYRRHATVMSPFYKYHRKMKKINSFEFLTPLYVASMLVSSNRKTLCFEWAIQLRYMVARKHDTSVRIGKKKVSNTHNFLTPKMVLPGTKWH